MSHSEETKRKISQSLMGHKHSPETIAKLRGRKRTPEFREHMRQISLGRIPWNKGKTGVYSPETLKKISERTKEAMSKVVFTDEMRNKIRRTHLGKKISEQEREKNRQSQYRRFEKEIHGYNYQDDGRRLRRKVRLQQNGGHHSRLEWELLKQKHNSTCLMCGKQEPEIKLTRDHIIAVIDGGNDNITNIQPLCRPCNSRKRNKAFRACVTVKGE
jgi:5-methylcytosine-specific restriction endonuclease McrA